VQDNKAERTVDALAACQLPEDSTEIRAAALSPTLRGSRGDPDAVPLRLRPQPDALDPGFHGARTHWILGFIAFQRGAGRLAV